MSIFIKHCKPSLATGFNCRIWRLNSTSADVAAKNNEEDEEFRVLDILKKKDRQQKRVARRADVQPDRADRMATDQVSFFFKERKKEEMFFWYQNNTK